MPRLFVIGLLVAGCATARPEQPAPFRLRFAIDAESEKHLLFSMFSHPDPAGLENRARSMKVPLELAHQIQGARDYSEVASAIGSMVEEEYSRNKGEMADSLKRQQEFWDANLLEFSTLVRGLTGEEWFHPEYVCNLTAFQRGASSWYGNVIHLGFALTGDLDRRIAAHELLLSHAFHIFRKHFAAAKVDDRKVWAFSEISAVLVMDDPRFDHFFPKQIHHEVNYFSQVNYQQIAPIEDKLRAVWRTRKDFADFVERSAVVLQQVGDPFDRSGEAPRDYLVLLEGTVRRGDQGLVASMKVKQPIDEKSLAPSEWDLLIDLDRDPQTHPWVLPGVTDVGVDCIVRLMWVSNRFRAEVIDFRTPEKHREPVEFSLDRDTIELRFRPEQIGSPASFDYVFLARPLVQPGERLSGMTRLPKATLEAK
jgi:hypothetical protein